MHAPDPLGHRELHVLRTLDRQQRGHPTAACCLTPGEYASVVMALRSRGLCGADVRMVRDDRGYAAVPSVDRVWLTAEGRGYFGGGQA